MSKPAIENNMREMGEHSIRIQHLEKQVAEMQKDIKRLAQIAQQARGIWKLMIAIVIISTICSAIIIAN